VRERPRSIVTRVDDIQDADSFPPRALDSSDLAKQTYKTRCPT